MPPAAQSKGPPAVVLGLNLTALGTIRALARQGVRVTALGVREGRPSEHTRWARQISDARCDTEACAELLEELAPRFPEPPVLFASADHHVLLMSRERERLQRSYRYVLPAPELVEALMDKGRLLRWSLEHAVPIPRTAVVVDEQGAREAAETLRFPCVLKPAVRPPDWTEHWPKVLPVATPQELLEAWHRMADAGVQLVVQEVIPGGDDRVCFGLLYIDREGQAWAVAEGRKLRQQPPQFGTTSLAISCPPGTVADAAVAVLQGNGYLGIGGVEFKEDPRDERLYMTEPTVGRPDLQSPLATAAGVNIPYAAYCDAAGLPLPEVPATRVGLKWCHERDDFAAAGAYRRQGQLSWGAWLRSLQGPRTYATLAWDDPVPFALLSLGFVARAVGVRSRWW